MEVGQHGKNYIMTNFPIQKKKLKLAMLGMTEGNGHPYSWSIIINGKYNSQELAKCPYAAIIDYISNCLLYTSPSPRDLSRSRMPSSA